MPKLLVVTVFLCLSVGSLCSAQTSERVAVADASTGISKSPDTNSNQPANSGGSPVAEPVVQPSNAQSHPVGSASAPITSRIAVGVKAGLLGFGVEAATPLTARTNLRFGFNAFSYGRNFTNDGINYDASVSFRSVESHFDWFPFGGAFHLSPGLMIYNGNKITGNASVAGGQQFSLGDTDYMSDTANPISGNGKIAFNKVAPTFLVGWGNLLPRKEGKHFSVPFELGVVFSGAPKSTLTLIGNACNPDGTGCHDISTDSTFQSNVVDQQNKLNSDMSAFKVYPVISIGFGYKF